ncbi:hypothetical protein [uncultured Dokdonia sp.]|uniref:hypothetical protein n=1 Tax=uncultured Dokdonia sp. TaxID=575653 RepID=UPI002632459B|nr:hypothetical protein [uncultured Dokdonia sp.]
MKSSSPHHLSDRFQLTNRITSKIATIYIYNKNIAVVEVHEGVNLSYASAASLLFKGLLVLKNRHWVYISHRVHSYSVVPTDYEYLHKINTLKALSIVVPTGTDPSTTAIEQIFCRKPFQLFNNGLEEAMIWAEKTLKDEVDGLKNHRDPLLF